jgi:hypothetical protein
MHHYSTLIRSNTLCNAFLLVSVSCRHGCCSTTLCGKLQYYLQNDLKGLKHQIPLINELFKNLSLPRRESDVSLLQRLTG